MSSPPSLTVRKLVQRPSRFIEGAPITGPDLWERTANSEHFFAVLSEMDEFERRKQRDLNCSAESLSLPNTAIPAPIASSDFGREEKSYGSLKRRTTDGKRSIVESSSGSSSSGEESDNRETFKTKFIGRWRVLTPVARGRRT
jgi:hypothetical protein